MNSWFVESKEKDLDMWEERNGWLDIENKEGKIIMTMGIAKGIFGWMY